MSSLKRSWRAHRAAVITLAAAAAVVSGGVAFAAPPDNNPSSSRAPAATYFARVGDDGTQAVLVAGQGVASVSRDENDQYFVTFDNPVDTCSWTASINPWWGGPPSGWGPIVVGLNWDNTVDPPENQTPDPHVLRVWVSDGENNRVLIDGPATSEPHALLATFSVTATCSTAR